MGEGYICDRCGSTHGGTADTFLTLGDGIERVRVAGDGENYRGPGTILWDVMFDLCPGCRSSFRQWWRDGGGDPGEVRRDE
jgi:hypothetical protein